MNRSPEQVEDQRFYYEDQPSHYIEGLKKAFDMQHRVGNPVAPIRLSATDRQLAEQFWRHLRQTESNLDRLESLLRRRPLRDAA